MLKNEIRDARNDSVRIVRMFRLAWFYLDRMDRYDRADSVSTLAIGLAEKTKDVSLFVLACNLYMESNDLDYCFGKARDYGTLALALCRTLRNPVMEWRTCHNLATLYLTRYDCQQAEKYAGMALHLAARLENLELRARSHLDYAGALDCRNNKTEAFNNYISAIEIAETLEDTALMIKCYSGISSFFNILKHYEKSIEYKLKEQALVRTIRPVDSLRLLWMMHDLDVIKSYHKKEDVDLKKMLFIIDWAIRNDVPRLKNWEFALYRQFLIEGDKINELHDLYVNLYPAEFQALRQSDPSLYVRLLAFFAERNNKPDSAMYYFLRVQKMLANHPSELYRAMFHVRFGQFLLRYGKTDAAITQYKESLRLAEASHYYGKQEFILIPLRGLQAMYSKKGDYRNAWAYAAKVLYINDSIKRMSRTDELIMKDINRVLQDRERKAEQERQEADRDLRQQRIQKNMMAGGIGFLVILSWLIFRNYRNQKRSNWLLDQEKKKSDDLLLNILPVETAEELKLTGAARAKRYEEVTVMFTDFKDFTQASEQLHPENLVSVIHHYFSEFDRIISRFGIEKIKIIGDSYMCAGGLPVGNETHPYDVVSAALELQEFMASEKIRRLNDDMPWFELRIGIHTGPVIAGIVGLKKFAYDIWGDTVNTASRMENCGEVNRVNISGSTYEKVRDSFHCTYRGKVSAKHKGEIDMYFVDYKILS